MIDFIPIFVSIASLVIIFYMLKTLISYVGDELSAITDEYAANTARISKQLGQIYDSTQNQSAITLQEFQKALANHKHSTSIMVQNINKLIEAMREIERTANRQQSLENEIMRLKSILARKEKQNVSE